MSEAAETPPLPAQPRRRARGLSAFQYAQGFALRCADAIRATREAAKERDDALAARLAQLEARVAAAEGRVAALESVREAGQ